MVTRQEVQELSKQLADHKKQLTETNVRLQAIYSLLLRVLDTLHNDNKDPHTD